MVATLTPAKRWPKAAEFCSEEELRLFRLTLAAYGAEGEAHEALRIARLNHRRAESYHARLRAQFDKTPGGQAYRAALAEFFKPQPKN